MNKPTRAKMGLWSTISLGRGGMIGAGIFSVPGVAAEIAGKKEKECVLLVSDFYRGNSSFMEDLRSGS